MDDPLILRSRVPNRANKRRLGAHERSVRSWHSDQRVQAGLGSVSFLLPLLPLLSKIIFKTPLRLVKYDPHLIDCTPARFAEGKYFYLPATNVFFKEHLRLFHFPSKLWWAQTSNILSFLFWNKIWQIIGF